MRGDFMTQSDVPPLTTGTKLSYGIGQTAEGLTGTGMATFVLFYYNQVLGLSGTLAGLALGAALVLDALTDPVAGSISDNLTSRLGRRHPFIFASALPLGASFVLLFLPPVSMLDQWGLFLWLTATVLLTRVALTVFYVPHTSLGAELSEDYEERTTVVSFRYFFATFGGLLVYVLGFGWFFADARGGQTNAANYAPFAFTVAAIAAASVFWTGWGTRHRIRYMRVPEPSPVGSIGQVLARVFRDLGSALSNRSFRWLFGGVLILFVMIGVDSALNLYMFNYFWELPSSLTLWLFLALPLGALAGAPFTGYLHRFVNKHTTVLLGTAWFALCELIPVVLRLAGWFPENGSPAVFVTLLIVRFLMGVGSIQSTVSFNSMMADVADQHELESNRRQEGIFFGAISFSAKGTAGLGNLVAGVGLDLIGWPHGTAVHATAAHAVEKISPATIAHLGILYGPLVAAFAAVAVWCLSHYDLTRERHAEIQARLAERRRAEAENRAAAQSNGRGYGRGHPRGTLPRRCYLRHERSNGVEPAGDAAARHRVEHQVLNARLGQLGQSFGHGGRTTRHRLRRLHHRIGVEIQTQREGELVRIPAHRPAGGAHLVPFVPHHVEWLKGRVKAVAVARHPLECGGCCTADPDRQRLLYRLRLEGHGRERVELTGEARCCVGEQAPEDFELLVSAASAVIPRHTEHCGFLRHPADADTQDQASFGDDVQRGELLRRRDRRAVGENEHRGPEANPPGAAGDEQQRADGVEPSHGLRRRERTVVAVGITGTDVGRPADMVAHPQGIDTEVFARRGEVADHIGLELTSELRRVKADLHRTLASL